MTDRLDRWVQTNKRAQDYKVVIDGEVKDISSLSNVELMSSLMDFIDALKLTTSKLEEKPL